MLLKHVPKNINEKMYSMIASTAVDENPNALQSDNYEKVYQKHFCNKINGRMEVKLNDGSRVDCLTTRYAIEVDFANKSYEGIGQALYYGIKTGKKPGVVMISKKPHKDQKNLTKLLAVAKKYGITIWTIDSNFKIKRYK